MRRGIIEALDEPWTITVAALEVPWQCPQYLAQNVGGQVRALNAGTNEESALALHTADGIEPWIKENPATLPNAALNGSLQLGSVCSVNTLRPACAPTAMRYVIEWSKS